jgi:hypothetical protein
MCGKLLVPTVRDMIDSLAGSKNPDYGIDGEIRALLLRVSPAAADRLLKKARKANETGGRPALPGRHCAPMRRCGHTRKTVTPGHLAFDTAAHCGGPASGQYCKTLTGTDVSSGRAGERPLLNAANRWVQEAFADTGAGLPFPLKGGTRFSALEVWGENPVPRVVLRVSTRVRDIFVQKYDIRPYGESIRNYFDSVQDRVRFVQDLVRFVQDRL